MVRVRRGRVGHARPLRRPAGRAVWGAGRASHAVHADRNPASNRTRAGRACPTPAAPGGSGGVGGGARLARRSRGPESGVQSDAGGSGMPDPCGARRVWRCGGRGAPRTPFTRIGIRHRIGRGRVGHARPLRPPADRAVWGAGRACPTPTRSVDGMV